MGMNEKMPLRGGKGSFFTEIEGKGEKTRYNGKSPFSECGTLKRNAFGNFSSRRGNLTTMSKFQGRTRKDLLL